MVCKKSISIIIPSQGRKKLYELLDSIRSQTIDFSIEIIVVLNGVGFLTHQLVLQYFERHKISEKFGESDRNFKKDEPFRFETTVLCIEKASINRARNFGMGHADGQILLFLDDDVILPHSCFLKRILSLHQRNPELAAFGGYYSDSKVIKEKSLNLYNYHCNFWLISQSASTKKVLKRSSDTRSECKTSKNNDEGYRISNALLGGNFSIKSRLTENEKLIFSETLLNGNEIPFFTKGLTLGLTYGITAEHNVLHGVDHSFVHLLKRCIVQNFRFEPLVKSKPFRVKTSFLDLGHFILRTFYQFLLYSPFALIGSFFKLLAKFKVKKFPGEQIN